MKFENLYNLIHKMTAAEKRHLSIHANKDVREKAYMLLFDHIKKMDECNEQQLKQKLKGHPMLNQFTVAKNGLFEIILKSLRTFHEKNSEEQKLHAYLSEAILLKNRGLYKAAIGQLERAKKIAERHERHFYLLEILDKELDLVSVIGEENAAVELPKIQERLFEINQIANAEIAYKNSRNQLLAIMKKGKSVSANDQTAIQEILEKPHIQDISLAKSFAAKLHYFHAYATFHYLKEEHQNSKNYYSKMLELWDRHPHMRDANPRFYKAHIVNFLNICHLNREYNSFDLWLKRFRDIEDENFDEKAGSFQDYFHITLLYFLNTQKIQEAYLLQKEVKEGLEIYKNRINQGRAMTLRFNLFLTCFILEKHADALSWLDGIPADDKLETKVGLKTLARMMRLILYHEQKRSHLESQRLSIYRRLKQEDQLHAFELAVLNHIRLLEQNLDKKQEISYWEAFLERLNEIKENDSRTTGLNEIMLWAESKLQKRPLLEIYQEHHR